MLAVVVMTTAGCEIAARPEEVLDAALPAPDAFVQDWGSNFLTWGRDRTPVGALADYRSIAAKDDCGFGHEVTLSGATLGGFDLHMVIVVPFYGSRPLTGSLSARVTVYWVDPAVGWQPLVWTRHAHFSATWIEPPDTGARIEGRLVVDEPGWDINLSIDMILEGSGSCTD